MSITKPSYTMPDPTEKDQHSPFVKTMSVLRKKPMKAAVEKGKRITPKDKLEKDV